MLLSSYIFTLFVTICLISQLSGINAAIFFSTSIFSSAGLSESDAQSATLGMGAMNVAMTFVSLVLIEKAGRKTLMLIGLSVMVVCTTMLLVCLVASVSFFFTEKSFADSRLFNTSECLLLVLFMNTYLHFYDQIIFFQESAPWLAYVSIVMVISFVVGFATGPGSIPWFFVTELFTQSARGMATSIAVVTNWTANFLVGLCFLPMQVSSKQN